MNDAELFDLLDVASHLPYEQRLALFTLILTHVREQAQSNKKAPRTDKYTRSGSFPQWYIYPPTFP